MWKIKKIGLCLLVFLLMGCEKPYSDRFEYGYGVFLNCDASDLDDFEDYETVVLDAEFFSESDIAFLKKKGHIVYSYLNVGSVERFRSFYSDFLDITLGNYENWVEERWVDVSQERWQNHIKTLKEKYLQKGVDGFFVDNSDVYYHYPTEAIFLALKTILQDLIASKRSVIVNGGDIFVKEYLNRNYLLSDLLTGINQETVFSKINFTTKRFSSADLKDRRYFQDYIELIKQQGGEVFLLEYSKDPFLKRQIRSYCLEKHFHYYISDSIELD